MACFQAIKEGGICKDKDRDDSSMPNHLGVLVALALVVVSARCGFFFIDGVDAPSTLLEPFYLINK